MCISILNLPWSATNVEQHGNIKEGMLGNYAIRFVVSYFLNSQHHWCSNAFEVEDGTCKTVSDYTSSSISIFVITTLHLGRDIVVCDNGLLADPYRAIIITGSALW